MDIKAKTENARIESCFRRRDGSTKLIFGCSNRCYELYIDEAKKAYIHRYAQGVKTIGAVIRIVVSDDLRVIGFGDPVFDRFIFTMSGYNETEMPEESFFRPLTEEELAELTS